MRDTTGCDYPATACSATTFSSLVALSTSLLSEIRAQGQDKENESNGYCGKADHSAEVQLPGCRLFAELLFELAFLNQAGILERTLVTELFFALNAGEDHHVHGEASRTQVR